VAYKDLFKHADSHILGELRHITDEGRRVTALALYETPVRADTVPPVKPVIIVHIIGDARLIKCRYADCTKSQRWEIGRAGFLSLMDRMGMQDKLLEMESGTTAEIVDTELATPAFNHVMPKAEKKE
jgi:hypothetical protein